MIIYVVVTHKASPCWRVPTPPLPLSPAIRYRCNFSLRPTQQESARAVQEFGELWKERVSCTVGATNIQVGKADRLSPCVMCTCTKDVVRIAAVQLAQTFSPAAILNDHVRTIPLSMKTLVSDVAW